MTTIWLSINITTRMLSIYMVNTVSIIDTMNTMSMKYYEYYEYDRYYEILISKEICLRTEMFAQSKQK